MGESTVSQKPLQILEGILGYVEKSSGLSSKISESGFVQITQSADGKVFRFQASELDEILQRVDADGKTFIQVNFKSGVKVLVTDTLVGFKPKETFGLDMGKIPKVVTTPDLLSVLEAIEDSMSSDATPDSEIEVLKKVFQAILLGGELVGFELSFERKWLSRLTASKVRASA